MGTILQHKGLSQKMIDSGPQKTAARFLFEMDYIRTVCPGIRIRLPRAWPDRNKFLYLQKNNPRLSALAYSDDDGGWRWFFLPPC